MMNKKQAQNNHVNNQNQELMALVRQMASVNETQATIESNIVGKYEEFFLPGARLVPTVKQPILFDLEQYVPSELLVKQYDYCTLREPVEIEPGILYVGQWYKGKMHGFGKILTNNLCTMYQGFFFQNQKQGPGRQVFQGGEIFEGEYFQDKIMKGTFYNASGYKFFKVKPIKLELPQIRADKQYFGRIKNGQRDGIGRYQWSDGTYYMGQFKEGQIEGYGEMIYSNNRVYKGFWKNNKMEGFGQFEWPDGTMYVGQYVQDKKNGFGIFRTLERLYIGQFYKGKPTSECQVMIKH